jgi:hypothetical protein
VKHFRQRKTFLLIEYQAGAQLQRPQHSHFGFAPTPNRLDISGAVLTHSPSNTVLDFMTPCWEYDHACRRLCRWNENIDQLAPTGFNPIARFLPPALALSLFVFCFINVFFHFPPP